MSQKVLLLVPVLVISTMYECVQMASGEILVDPNDGPSMVVKVDERVELISIIYRLAGNPEYGQGRVRSYIKDIEEHFNPVRDHEVVKLAQQLRRARGVSYDAPMGLAIHLVDAKELKEKVSFDEWPTGLDKRWQLAEVREFLEKARAFVKDGEFKKFFDEHQELYEISEARAQKVIDDEAHLEWFGEFFGEQKNAKFYLYLGMVNGGACYGPRFIAGDQEEFYCILGVWKSGLLGLGKPVFDASMLDTVVHEFCHSYVNRHVYAHEAELKEAGEKLFGMVQQRMKRMAYGSWPTMMHESVVRASVVRYLQEYQGEAAAEAQIKREIGNGFLWMRELAELLGEYEEERDEYETFEAFFPKVIEFFVEYSKK
ncbi:MAG: DUF4932 domain-containing protein [Planctomycetes bacterium]|nr:DUF4932 domain-containing protein [Planctomycetota bacterium]